MCNIDLYTKLLGINRMGRMWDNSHFMLPKGLWHEERRLRDRQISDAALNIYANHCLRDEP